jgi:hypothetical protein
MRKTTLLLVVVLAALVLIFPDFSTAPGGLLFARKKNTSVPANDPTAKLFKLLDTSYDGKLSDFYVLADVYQDPARPGEWQHILRVDYDKSLYFGKLKIVVRSISKPTEAQLKTYTVKQMYDFGSDSEEFEKIAAGPLGQTGDLYLRAEGNMPLASAPITADAKAAYEKYLTQYLIPALEKSKGSD